MMNNEISKKAVFCCKKIAIKRYIDKHVYVVRDYIDHFEYRSPAYFNKIILILDD